MWWLIPCTASAFVAQQGVVRHDIAVRSMQESWQETAERAFLDVRVPPREKIEALRSLAGRFEDISRDVRSGDPTALFAPRDREGAKALARQLREDVLPELLEVAPKAPRALASRLRNMQQPKLKVPQVNLREELDNLYGTPSNLEQPAFQVLDTLETVEIRRYDTLVTAATPMSNDDLAGGEEFARLASYVFGNNERDEAIGMTTPVEIDFQDGQPATMAFSLPSSYTVATAPNSDGIDVQERPPALYASFAFPGLATNTEVQRALVAIRGALDGSKYNVLDGYKLLQYNPPYTLPWRRSNAVLVPVEEMVTSEDGEGQVAIVIDDDELDDGGKPGAE